MKYFVYSLIVLFFIGCGIEPKAMKINEQEITEEQKLNIQDIAKEEIINIKMQTNSIEVSESNDSKVVLINTSRYIYFATSKYVVQNKLKVKKIISKFNKYNHIYFYIVGHTDSAGTDKNNYLLSEMRAREIYKLFISSGFSESKLDYIGYGEEQPIATNATKLGRAKNRRVELIVSNVSLASKRFLDKRIINIAYLNNHNNMNPGQVEISVKGITKNKSEQELRKLYTQIVTPKRKFFDATIEKRKRFIHLN